MIDVVETRDALDRAIADDREAARLRGLLVRAARRGRCGPPRARARAAAARARGRRRPAGSTASRLSALMAALRGSRTGELDRERAEEVAARYALQAATARLAAVEARRRGGRPAARAARGPPPSGARRPPRPTRRRCAPPGRAGGRARARPRRARAGAGRGGRGPARHWQPATAASALLDAARGHLGSAESWSTYDTWFGGGLLASSVKHDRIDGASDRIGEAQQALFEFARELADVDAVPTVRADLGISPTSRTVDVWFDNVFTDLSVGRAHQGLAPRRRLRARLGPHGSRAAHPARGRPRAGGGRAARAPRRPAQPPRLTGLTRSA